MKPMHLDKRPIDYIHGYNILWQVRKRKVTKIVVYRENGQGAEVPYLAVYKGDFIIARVPANMVEVVYEED